MTRFTKINFGKILIFILFLIPKYLYFFVLNQLFILMYSKIEFLQKNAVQNHSTTPNRKNKFS